MLSGAIHFKGNFIFSFDSFGTVEVEESAVKILDVNLQKN